MKTIKSFSYAIFVLLIGIAISSCKGDDGADGIDGIDGATGSAGQDGNANVIYSEWIEYDSTNWEAYVVEYGVGTRKYPITVSNLTEEIVNHGVVLFYSKLSGTGDTVYALPFSHNLTTGLQNLSHTYELSKITLRMINHDGVGDPGIFGGPSSYRYILIEGSTPEVKRTGDSQQTIYTELKNAGIDINIYNEVLDYYGINP